MAKNKIKKHISKICSRHSCSIKTNVKKCKYCKKIFCKKHMLGFAPHVGIDESFDKREDPNSGHPCYPYIKYKEDREKEKEKEREYRKALNSFLDGSKIKNFNKPIHSYVKDYSTKRGTVYGTKNKKENNKKEIHEIAIERFEAKQKKKSKKSKNKIKIPIKGIIYFIFVIGIIALIYFNLGQIISFINISNNNTNISNEITIDSQSLQAFSYINDYRLDSGLPKLEYSKNIYELVKGAAERKGIDSTSFESNSDFLEVMRAKFDMSKISYSFYKTYFIKGEGLDKFYKEFDKNYGARNLIKSDKYNYGAIYCSLDYCVLFIYKSPEEIGSTESVKKNVDIVPIKNILEPKDSIVSKCESNFNSCGKIWTQKYGGSFSLIKIEKFNNGETAKNFYNTWRSIFQVGLPDELGLYSSSDINLYLPLVLIASNMKGPNGQLPIVMVCDRNGELLNISKAYFQCG